MGWSSILIPGSGEPNFDSWYANPFETWKQRREKEIRSLHESLPPESIMLDPKKIGTVRPPKKREKRTKKEREEEMEAAIEAANGIEFKNKTKGWNKAGKRAKKKQEIIEKVKKQFVEQHIKESEELSRKKRQRMSEEDGVEVPKSLQQFTKKKTAYFYMILQQYNFC